MKKLVLKKTVVANLSSDAMDSLKGGVATLFGETCNGTCNQTKHCIGSVGCVTTGIQQTGCYVCDQHPAPSVVQAHCPIPFATINCPATATCQLTENCGQLTVGCVIVEREQTLVCVMPWP